MWDVTVFRSPLNMGCMSSKIFPSDSSDDKKPRDKNPSVLVGDVTTKHEKKEEREMKIKEKQFNRNTKAEEISGKIMEEKERLSLGARSRGTSQATSRAGSPTPTSHKQVHFRPDEVMSSSTDSCYRFILVSKPVKSSLKNQNESNTQIMVENNSEHKGPQENNSSIRQDDVGKRNGAQDVDKSENNMDGNTEVKHQKGQRNKLCTIEERTNSRCSTKSEDKDKLKPDDIKKG
ncbi:uncharacterized protein LOC132556931 [Ylistrum balloti]|uniref:uncharacterized protein LOC132556931 n=1 Tax=Ylistrum balloti TaxID=509963 RepID=UPI002905C86A|nr:uncharacterized protein LOC132556931 [Ylistrum balloti]